MDKARIINYVDMSFKIIQECAELSLKYLNQAKELGLDDAHQHTLKFAANMLSTDLERIARERDDVCKFLQRVLPADPDERDLVAEANKIDES